MSKPKANCTLLRSLLFSAIVFAIAASAPGSGVAATGRSENLTFQVAYSDDGTIQPVFSEDDIDPFEYRSVSGQEIEVPGDYSTIQSAIDAAASGDVIKVTYGKYVESLTLAASKGVAISGGWDAGYSEKNGIATILGALTLRKGILEVDGLCIAGQKKAPFLALMTASGTQEVRMAWIPGTDGATPEDEVRYKIYLSESESFTPGAATLKKTVTGVEQTEVAGLKTNTRYYGKVVAVYDSSTSQPSNEVNTKTYKQAVQLDPSAVVQTSSSMGLKTIDYRSQVDDLGLGTHTTSDGITFVYANSGGTAPAVGAFLFSEGVDGAIVVRKVESVSTAGGVITVVTSDASLADALDVASVNSSIQLFDIQSYAENLKVADSKMATIERSVSNDGSQYSRIDWEDGLLSARQITYAHDDDDGTVVPDGKTCTIALRQSRAVESSFMAEVSVEFEPDLISEAEFGGVAVKQLEYGKIAARGTLTMEAFAEYNFSAAGSVNKNFSLFEKTWTSIYQAGPVPVYQEIILTIDVEATASAEAKIKAEASAMFAEIVEVGAKYEGGQWNAYIENREENELSASLDIVGEAQAEIRLIPKIEVKFYKLISSSLSVEPYLGSSLTFEETTNNLDFLAANPQRIIQLTSFDASLGIEANIAVNLGAFGHNWEILPSTCIMGTGDCLWGFDEIVLFSLPDLALSTDIGGAPKLKLQATNGVFNSFSSSSVRWEVFSRRRRRNSGRLQHKRRYRHLHRRIQTRPGNLLLRVCLGLRPAGRDGPPVQGIGRRGVL